ncbi:MAG: type II toxin-antitoxin system VapC family toxin [Aestuariivirga sp.]
MIAEVLDSSAVLAVVLNEPGASVVKTGTKGVCISAVNLAEVVSKLCDQLFSKDQIDLIVGGLDLQVVPFDESQAIVAGQMRTATRHLGLSLGDRACLALAIGEKATVITADRSWAGLDLGIEIKLIR